MGFCSIQFPPSIFGSFVSIFSGHLKAMFSTGSQFVFDLSSAVYEWKKEFILVRGLGLNDWMNYLRL